MGRVITHDELLFDVVTIARQRGWGGETPAETSALQEVETVVESSRVGEGVVTNPDAAAVLRHVAHRALIWLDERAPTGYRFELRNALRLVPLDDLDAAAVAPEAVINAALGRGIPLAAPEEAVPPHRGGVEQLVRGHVARSADGWVVRLMPFVIAGPFTSSTEAVDTVDSARDELAATLRAAGAEDLASTRDRWVPVHVESDLPPGATTHRASR
ncbi:MAG: hypothetical protein ACRDRH_09760 [Pseudonocardia sp.]